jgi:hypothetical protein
MDLQQVERIAGLGLIDTEIAQILGISEQTLNTYKKKPEFLEALKRGKLKVDEKVIESLYNRAIGYDNPNAVKIFMPAGAKSPVYAKYTEHYPPDVTAQIFWLKNRRKQDWRDREDAMGIIDESARSIADSFAKMVQIAGAGKATPDNIKV